MRDMLVLWMGLGQHCAGRVCGGMRHALILWNLWSHTAEPRGMQEGLVWLGRGVECARLAVGMAW